MLQQFLTASILGVFCVGFAVIWLKNRDFHDAGFWALSYGSASIAFFLEVLYLLSKEALFLTPVGDTLYLLAALLLSVGLAKRFNQKTPKFVLSVAFLTAFMPTMWFWFVIDNFTLRVELISYGCALSLAIGALNIYGRIKSLLDRALFYVIMAFAVQQVLATVITLRFQDEILNSQSFLDSKYIEFLHFSISLFSVSIAVMLFASLAIDIIDDLRRKSDTDSLTGFNNRSSFEAQAIEAINLGRQTSIQSALIICDIDNFKKVNDNLGHLAGDRIIKSFAESLSLGRRPVDIVGRIGGDEFAIFLPKANGQMARLMAEYARDNFSQELEAEGKVLRITASFGISEVHDSDTYRSLFQRADKMLYKSKESGRDRVSLHEIDKAEVQTRQLYASQL